MQVSIVNYNKLGSGFRLDAEYYKPIYLNLESELRKFKTVALEYLANEIRCGPFGSTILCETYFENGVIVARPFNIVNFTIERENLVFISIDDVKQKKLKTYNEGDIFFSRVGDIRCGVVPKFESAITISPNIIAVKIDKEKINPYYIVAFFNSRYGLPQIERGLKVVAQPTIQTDLIARLRVVQLSSTFQNSIERIFRHYFVLEKQSALLYSQAEQILLAELGLMNWKPKHQLSFVKNFSDSKNADRIDAEYFQPMYDEIVEKVIEYKNGYKTVDEAVKIKDRNFTPKDDVSYKYIELANIAANGHINGFTEAIGKDLPTRARLKVNFGDVIVSAIEGSLSSIALINDDLDNALCSTGFYVINSGIFNSETLLVLLKSSVGQLQLKKGCSGTILTAINKEEFKRILLPNISRNIQEQIKQIISEMYKAKSISITLLDIAKRGVEIAIEQNEVEAEKWINNELEKHKIVL
jgi:restriction endonuclease S subunit